MRTYQIFFIIANIYIAVSFLIEDAFLRFGALIFGFVWLIIGILLMIPEQNLDRLENKSERIKFEMIVNLLSIIAGIKLKRKLKPKERKK